MNNLQQNINNIIELHIQTYFTNINKKYNIPKNELILLWEQLKVINPEIQENNKPEIQENNNKCIYIISRGKNVGNYCNNKVTKGFKYCSKHKIHENKKQKVKVNNRVPKFDTASSKIKLTKNRRFKKFWHEETSFIFDIIDNNKTNQIVIGKVFDGKIIDLTEEDFETCKKYNFTYWFD